MKLSVIMPNYNDGDRIGNSLTSILDQSRSPDEVIVVDDGSTDNSREVIRGLMKRYPQLSLHHHEENQGPVAACNTAFRLATGDYIFGFPADDVVLPGWFEQAEAMLKQHPGVGICCGDYYMVDVETGKVKEMKNGWGKAPAHYTPEAFAEVLKGWWVPSCASFINRQALKTAGYFLDDLKWHCDWFAYLVVAFRYGLCHISSPVIARRRHEDAYGTQNRRDWSVQSQVLRQILERLKSPGYRDVLPSFIRSGAMLFFNNEIDRLIMTNPEMWDMENLLLAGLPMSYRHQACKQHIDDMWKPGAAMADEEKIREALGIEVI